MVENKDEAQGRVIVRYCGGKKCLISLVKTAMNLDIEHAGQSEVLFREDTPTTKLMSALFGQCGSEYLAHMVPPTFRLINKSALLMQEDWANGVEHSPECLAQVEKICDDFLARLYRSAHLMPVAIRVLLSHVQKEATPKFPEVRQRVVGSFVFLRFLVPAFLFPERILKLELSKAAEQVGRFVSRVLLPMVSGGQVPDKIPSLQKYADSKQKELASHFDELADISELSFTSRDLELPTDVNTAHTDLKYICDLLMDSGPSMRKVIESFYGPDTMGRYLQFTNIQNPPVFPVTDKMQEVYYKAVGNLTDLLPTDVCEGILAVSHANRNRKNLFGWFSRAVHTEGTACKIAKRLPGAREEMKSVLSIFVELHEFLTRVLAKWDQPVDIEQRKQVLTRKAYLLSYLIERLLESAVSFFVPELWEVWNNFLEACQLLAELFVLDGLSGFQGTGLVQDVLTQVLISARWIISRLVHLQSRNLQGV